MSTVGDSGVVAAALPAAMAQKVISEKPAADLEVTSVEQESPELFEIHYALKNNGKTDLYIPYHQIDGSIALTTYSLLQRTKAGAWVNIGPSYDVASHKSKVLQPGATLSLSELISASSGGVGLSTGNGSAQTYYKIRVGYYLGAAVWQKRLEAMKEQQLTQQTLSLPKIEFAYSEQFAIPAAAK